MPLQRPVHPALAPNAACCAVWPQPAAAGAFQARQHRRTDRATRRTIMPPSAVAGAAARGSGAALNQAVRAGKVLTGLFLNSASPLVAEQLATLPYDYMLVGAAHAASSGAWKQDPIPAHAWPPFAAHPPIGLLHVHKEMISIQAWIPLNNCSEASTAPCPR